MELTNSNFKMQRALSKNLNRFLNNALYTHALLRMPFTNATKAVSSVAAISRHMKGPP